LFWYNETMEMNRKVLEFIRCPACGPDRGLLRWDGGLLACAACGEVYPTDKGYVDFSPVTGNKPPPHLAQRTMESGPAVKIYEKVLRPALTGLVGSLRWEMKIIPEMLDLRPGMVALDVACGTGNFSRIIAGAVGETGAVIGLDISAPMLAVGAKTAARREMTNLSFLRSDVMAAPLKPSGFDAANCTGALHLFEDKQGACRRIWELLTPGGRFAGTTYNYRGGVLSRVRRGVSSMGINFSEPEQLESLLMEAGFEGVELKTKRQTMAWLAVKPA